MNPATLQNLCQIGVAIFSILAILCGYGAHHYGNKANELKAVDESKQNKEIATGIEKTQLGQKEIKNLLLERLQDIDSKRQDELLSKYSAGYCLFGIDQKNIIIPYKSSLETEWKINWKTAKIMENTKETIQIKAPEMVYTKHNISFGSGDIYLFRKVGSTVNVIRADNIGIIAEVLDLNDYSTIAVLGFKEYINN